jgi:hypothetical protein
MKRGERIPDTDPNARPTLYLAVTLGAAGDKGSGLTARDDDVHFECSHNHRLSFFSELPTLDIVLWIFSLTRQGRGT